MGESALRLDIYEASSLTFPELEAVKGIISSVNGNGITYKELNDRLPYSINSGEKIEDVLMMLDGEVEIVNKKDLRKINRRKRLEAVVDEELPKKKISSNDDIGIYLSEVGKNPLLTRAEELRYARDIVRYRDEFIESSLECENGIKLFYKSCEAVSQRFGFRENKKELLTSNFRVMALLEQIKKIRSKKAKNLLYQEAAKHIREVLKLGFLEIYVFESIGKNCGEFKRQDRDYKKSWTKDMVYLYESFQEARQNLAKGNFRLSVSIAKKYRRVGGIMGLSFLDLIQEANTGLMKSIDRYKPELGYKVSTYATWWIRQSITRALHNQGKTIRVPVYMNVLIMNFDKAREELSKELGRKPHDEEVGERLGLDEKHLNRVLRTRKRLLSLDRPTKEDGDSFQDFIPDKKAENQALEYAIKKARVTIEDRLSKLRPKETELMRFHYGFADGIVYTLEEIGGIFGVSRARAGQIKEMAKEKLRNPRNSRPLEACFEDINFERGVEWGVY